MKTENQPKGNAGNTSGKTTRPTFYDRVLNLADTTLRCSKDTTEREQALEVIKLMEQRKAA